MLCEETEATCLHINMLPLKSLNNISFDYSGSIYIPLEYIDFACLK